MSDNTKAQIKKYFNSLVEQFANQSNISYTIVFKDYLGGEGNQKTLGHTNWKWQGRDKKKVSSGKHTFEVSFLNHYEDEERWRGTVTHEFSHLYLFTTIGDHNHDDNFYSHMEKFENWMDQKWGLSPRKDKSGDWNQHVDQSEHEEKQKEPCTSCGKREIPCNTAGECFACHQGQVERNQEIEEENQRIGANNQERKQEQEEFNRLDDLLRNAKDLTKLEKNWQMIQNSPLYSSSKKSFKKYTTGEEFIDNKTELDKYYSNRKSHLQPSQDKGNSNSNDSNEQKEFNRLVDLLRDSKTLTELENNWQKAKTSSVYSSSKYNWKNKSLDNKTGLNNHYEGIKNKLQPSNTENEPKDLKTTEPNSNKGSITVLVIGGIILGIYLIFKLLSRPARKKKKRK